MAAWIWITIGLVVFYAILLLIDKTMKKKGGKAYGPDYTKRESTRNDNDGNTGSNINGTNYDPNN